MHWSIIISTTNTRKKQQFCEYSLYDPWKVSKSLLFTPLTMAAGRRDHGPLCWIWWHLQTQVLHRSQSPLGKSINFLQVMNTLRLSNPLVSWFLQHMPPSIPTMYQNGARTVLNQKISSIRHMGLYGRTYREQNRNRYMKYKFGTGGWYPRMAH